MKIVSCIMLVLGAVIAYGSNFILSKFYKKEYSEKEIAVLKTIGLLVALVGAIIIFVNY